MGRSQRNQKPDWSWGNRWLRLSQKNCRPDQRHSNWRLGQSWCKRWPRVEPEELKTRAPQGTIRAGGATGIFNGSGDTAVDTAASAWKEGAADTARNTGVVFRPENDSDTAFNPGWTGVLLSHMGSVNDEGQWSWMEAGEGSGMGSRVGVDWLWGNWSRLWREAGLAGLRSSLTSSTKTKMNYWGEWHNRCTDPGSNLQRNPWINRFV